jgi:GTP pyrophosphokinase
MNPVGLGNLRCGPANAIETVAPLLPPCGETRANIDNIVIKPLSADFREMTIDIEVNDVKHLNTIISHLRARPAVSKAERVNG